MPPFQGNPTILRRLLILTRHNSFHRKRSITQVIPFNIIFSISSSRVSNALVFPHIRTRNLDSFLPSCSCSFSHHRCLILHYLDPSTAGSSTWTATHAHSSFDARPPTPQPRRKSLPSARNDAHRRTLQESQ